MPPPGLNPQEHDDAGDGYVYQNGDYLFTTYSAEQVEGSGSETSTITVQLQ